MEADWIGLPRYSEEYVSGIQAFMENMFPLFSVGEEMKCPCKKCNDQYWHRQDVIYDHLICRGPSPLHANGYVTFRKRKSKIVLPRWVLTLWIAKWGMVSVII